MAFTYLRWGKLVCTMVSTATGERTAGMQSTKTHCMHKNNPTKNKQQADALEALSESSEDESTNMDEANALTAAAMRVEAERLENSAREAGAYPKGW